MNFKEQVHVRNYPESRIQHFKVFAATGRNCLKKLTVCAVLVAAVAVTGCTKDSGRDALNSETEQALSDTETKEIPGAETEKVPDAEAETLPATNGELYSYIIEQWKQGDVSQLYAYASDTVKSLVDQEGFNSLFLCLNETFGSINSVKDERIFRENGMDAYTATIAFENVEADVEIYLADLKIEGYNFDVRFLNSFAIEHEDGIVEHYFLLESGRYLLNAVYTCTDKETAPAVLLIPGSGPADYNESTGLLRPFEDIALELAKHGIHSLRFEKRTNRYAEEFTSQSGLAEEYFDDCNAAIEWIRSRPETKGVYLLGHSLGSQIAVFLAEDNEVNGLILLNGTARHLARVMEDQFSRADPSNAASYRQLSDLAVAATTENAAGNYFFGAADYYWADYNKYETVDLLKKSALNTLIINSRADGQLFEADIHLWQEEFGNDDNVILEVFEDISHFGYPADNASASSVYREAEPAKDMMEEIIKFINR